LFLLYSSQPVNHRTNKALAKKICIILREYAVKWL
jgi:hypothetical protein